ncbi:MAG: LamG domain-containing protein [Saprospiraceae bacterium]|nr:LamG domain-containing protein [Saprospiraceae bacterium]
MKNLIGLIKGFLILAVSLSFGTLFGQNHALLLNGSGSYVACGDFLTLSYTKEVWVKLEVDNLKFNNNIISGQSGHAFRIVNGKADAGQAGSWTQVQDPNPIEAGWQHYAVTYDDSTQLMTLYRNGAQVAQKVGVGPQTDAFVQLGSFGSCCHFRGMMDEVRIWDHARDGAEIAADYNRALAGTESGLLAYYNFNQGVANGDNTGITAVTDLTGNNDGTLKRFALSPNSTSNFVQSDLALNKKPETASNNALHLDGTKDYVDARATSTGLPQGREPRTMEAWVKTTQTSIGNFISWGRRANHMRNSMAIRNGKLAYIGQYLDFTGKTTINDGEWHHVAMSYDGENWAIYVDGKADGANGADPKTTDQNLKIGNLPEPHNGEYFDGTMDELRVWNVARTADEIVASMNTELTGKEAGLVAYYNFNQGVAGGDNSTVTTLMDQVGKNNGTLTDFALTGDASNWVAANPAIKSISAESMPVVKVLGAVWGVGDKNANCTAEVQTLANDPTTPFKVNGSNLGTDPKYGHTKELRVAYEINDVVYFRKQKDHSSFEFLGASKNPKITIKEAIWGVSGYESNVKDLVQNLVDHGAVGFISQGTVLGKDPKYGTKKILKLVYEVGGQTYEKAVKDHDFIYLTTAFEDAVKGVEPDAQDD